MEVLRGQIKVGGVQGVGKTSFISALSERFEQTGHTIPVIKGSLLMAQVLGCQPDEISKQDPFKRAEARRVMFDQIGQIPLGIRDAHFTVPTHDGTIETTEADSAMMAGYVLLIADPEIIRLRRVRSGRDRVLDIAEIERQQRAEQAAAEHIACSTQKELRIVQNNAPEKSVEWWGLVDEVAGFVVDSLSKTLLMEGSL